GQVDVRVLRPFPAAPENRELVAQHDDLELPLTTAADEQAKKPTEEPIQQRHQHNAQSEPTRTRSPSRAGTAEPNFFYPRAEPGSDAEVVVVVGGDGPGGADGGLEQRPAQHAGALVGEVATRPLAVGGVHGDVEAAVANGVGGGGEAAAVAQ